MTNTANSNQIPVIQYCQVYWGLTEKEVLVALQRCIEDGDLTELPSMLDYPTYYGDVIANKALN